MDCLFQEWEHQEVECGNLLLRERERASNRPERTKQRNSISRRRVGKGTNFVVRGRKASKRDWQRHRSGSQEPR
ncbi:hypothetical protein DsansV1_C03g0030301 [Dioscorea sansibarensis]